MGSLTQIHHNIMSITYCRGYYRSVRVSGNSRTTPMLILKGSRLHKAKIAASNKKANNRGIIPTGLITTTVNQFTDLHYHLVGA